MWRLFAPSPHATTGSNIQCTAAAAAAVPNSAGRETQRDKVMARVLKRVWHTVFASVACSRLPACANHIASSRRVVHK